MPKVVDHDAQRVKFAEAAMSLIARHGLEGVTMRAVAAEAGLSYGSLFHYFSSKDELLMHIVHHTASLQTRRVNEFTSQYSGLKALEHLLCDDAIITESSRDDWMVWVTFLYKAALQESFAEMHAELIDGWDRPTESIAFRVAAGRGTKTAHFRVSREAERGLNLAFVTSMAPSPMMKSDK